MKMYKLYFLKIVFFIFTAFLGAEQQSIFGFGLNTYLGIKNGNVQELVFEDKTQISKLIWNQSISFQVGTDIDLRIWRFFLKMNLNTSIPIKCGDMEDFDYLTPNTNKISHYSKHDAYLDKDFYITTYLSFRIHINKKHYSLFPLAGFTYQNRKWSAQNGYLQYPILSGQPWKGNEPKENLTGTIMSYEQAVWYPFVGIESKILINNKWSFGLIGFYYKYICIDSIDNHFLRLKQFYDIMRDGNGGKIEGWVIFKPIKYNGNFGFKISFNYEYFKAYGNTSYNNIGINKHPFIQSNNFGSGTKSSLFSLTFGVIISHNM